MKKYYECVIQKHYAGFGKWETILGDTWYADPAQYESDILSNTDYICLEREQADDIEDIRGTIYNEPDYVYAIRQQDSVESYIQYVGLIAVEED